MKKISIILLALVFSISFVFTSCEKEDNNVSKDEIVPKKFRVNIPTSINGNDKKSAIAKGDVLSGNDIYHNLTTFISVGDFAAKAVEDIIVAITAHHINQAMSFSFISDDDSRVKNLEVKEQVAFEGTTWEYMLTITDAESESAEDGGLALQVFWNTSPIEGIAIMKPYNIDRVHDKDAGDLMFRVDYSEAGKNGYDNEMTVYIVDFPKNDNSDRYHIVNLKMFAGKKGNIVDVYGNSEHPEAYFLIPENVGFDYAFVASADNDLNIGVAEVGLPSNILDESDRNVLLVDNSVKNVFTDEITEWLIAEYGVIPTDELINQYLKNAEAPGFFNESGFVQGGTAPNEDYTTIKEQIKNLSPYNPKNVHDMILSFKTDAAK